MLKPWALLTYAASNECLSELTSPKPLRVAPDADFSHWPSNLTSSKLGNGVLRSPTFKTKGRIKWWGSVFVIWKNIYSLDFHDNNIRKGKPTNVMNWLRRTVECSRPTFDLGTEYNSLKYCLMETSCWLGAVWPDLCKILSFWQNFESLGQFFEGILTIW